MIGELLPPEIHHFLKEIENLGFSLCLVGGMTRDYFFSNELGADLDFEIRPLKSSDHQTATWPQYYKKLHYHLDDLNLAYTELPYLITRVRFGDKNFEFSSPRSEIDLPGNLTHHHFRALLDPTLSYENSFKRRDFTINAIGIEMDLRSSSEKIVDPYGGLNDLRNEILRNITDDFFLDSVRFLRLIRFKLKFKKFTLDETLVSKLHLFNLTELSVHHFKEELFKSHPGEFLNFFSQLVISKKMTIPEDFKLWTKYTFPDTLSSKEELLAFVFLQQEKDAHKILTFFSMPEKKLKDLRSFNRSYEVLLQMEKQDFLDVLALPMKEALKHELFKDLKNLEQKKEWRFILKLKAETKKLSINWEDWEDVSVSASELESILPPLRSYYPYFKALKMIFNEPVFSND